MTYQAINQERDMIGAIIKNPEIIHTVREELEHRDFEDYTTSTMYEIMLQLSDKNIPIRIGEVGARMRMIDQTLQDFGGEETVKSILKNTGFPSMAPHYIKAIKQAAFRRRLKQLGEAMTDASSQDELSDEECLTALQTQTEGLTGMQRANIRSIKELYNELLNSIDNKAPVKSPKIGISDVDARLNGIGTKRLITVAGRPGGGKTTFVVQALQNIAKQGVGATILFTMEMDGIEIVEKMVSDLFGINYTIVQERSFSEQTLNTLRNDDRVSNSQMYVDDTPFIDINHVIQVCRAYKRKFGELGAIGIDYLGLMNKHKAKGETTTEAIGRITAALKQLARELDCSIFMLSQMNRENERNKGIPQMSDLRESGNIEQDSDMVMFLHKLPDEEQDDPRNTKIQLVVAKGRKTGTCVIDLNFNGSLQRISSSALKFVP